jgi:predicted metal-binding protein
MDDCALCAADSRAASTAPHSDGTKMLQQCTYREQNSFMEDDFRIMFLNVWSQVRSVSKSVPCEQIHEISYLVGA